MIMTSMTAGTAGRNWDFFCFLVFLSCLTVLYYHHCYTIIFQHRICCFVSRESMRSSRKTVLLKDNAEDLFHIPGFSAPGDRGESETGEPQVFRSKDHVWFIIGVGFPGLGHEVVEVALAFRKQLVLSFGDSKEVLHITR